MKRVLVDLIPGVDQLSVPSEAECHHLIRVRRTVEGEQVELLDGQGGLALAVVTKVGKHEVQLRVIHRRVEQRESPLRLTLLISIPQQWATLDSVVPALVQQGVHRIVLVNTQFGGSLKKTSEKAKTRIRAIAIQSLKQCGRSILPELVFADDFAQHSGLLVQHHDEVLMLHPGPVRLSQWQPPLLRSLAVMVGPEGGFSTEEAALAKELGCRLLGLGPRILKMETALSGICFWAQSRFGDY